MDDDKKYWIITGRRMKIQEYGQLLAEAIHRSIEPERDKDIPGIDVFL